MQYDEAAMGVAGVTAGGATGATALYFGGITGLSAAGVTSGLAAIGGSMVVGIGIIAALPLVGGIGAYAGYKAFRQRQKSPTQSGHFGISCCGLPHANREIAP